MAEYTADDVVRLLSLVQSAPSVREVDTWNEPHKGFLLIMHDNTCWMVDVRAAGTLEPGE